MKIAVIGRGLIGSAAARHLALMGHEILLIGPSEPADRTTHRGVFGSHYDEGRITRRNASHPFWAKVADAAIRRYGEIEQQSGIAFHTASGSLIAAPQGDPYLDKVAAVQADYAEFSEPLTPDALARQFPCFAFPGPYSGFHERAPAGHISPRRLVAAQTRAAERHGATVLDSVVERVEEVPEGLAILTANQRITVDRALVAAGGMTDHILPAPLGLKVLARTVVLFEVSPETAQRLAYMPSLVFQWDDRSEPYLLPPIRYPDGRFYIKLGGDPRDVPLTSAEATGDWFRSSGDPEASAYLHEMFAALMPDVEVLSSHSVPCMTTYTPSGLPVIARLTDRLSVAAAGNGAAAKSSDELGRLGAETVLGATHPHLAPPS